MACIPLVYYVIAHVAWLLWAASLAKLGGRLQTNTFSLQAAAAVQSLLDSPDLSQPSHAWLHALHSALSLLDLRQHWPRLVVTEIQEEAVRAPAQVLHFDTTYPGASPHAHLRHTRSVMVEAASRLQPGYKQSWHFSCGLPKLITTHLLTSPRLLQACFPAQYTTKLRTGQKSACLGKLNRTSSLAVPWGLTLLLIGPPVGVVPSTMPRYLKNPGARSAPAPWLALPGRNASLSSIFLRTVTHWLPMPSLLQQLLTPR